jgi:hypothetical protein
MVGVFGDDNRRDQRLGRDAAFDQMFGRRSLRHLALAIAAGVFGPARDNDLEARRDHVEPFRDVLADLDPNPVAAGAALVGDVDDDLLARQMSGQRAAIDLALARRGRPGWFVLALGFRLRLAGGYRLLDVLQHERELVRIELFRSRAEAMALKLLDDGDQAIVLGALGEEKFLERPCVVGKRIRKRRHGLMESFPIVGVTWNIWYLQSRNRRRRRDSHTPNARPIQPLQQRAELPRRQPHHPLAQ